MKIHMAVSSRTACGEYVAGDHLTVDKDGPYSLSEFDEDEPVVQTTSDPDFVTCKACLKTVRKRHARRK